MSAAERALTVEVGAPVTHVLSAVLREGARGAAVVAPPHPSYGGRMDNSVVLAAVEGFAQAGFASLRFDFRGCGSSSGEQRGSAADADDDYAAAMRVLRAASGAEIVVAGYSFGSAAALRAAARDEHALRVVAIAPPLALVDWAELSRSRQPVVIIVGDDDSFAPLPALRERVARLAHVRLDVIEDADHFFSGVNPEEIATRVRRSLA